MKREKLYFGVKFPVAAIKEAKSEIESVLSDELDKNPGFKYFKVFNIDDAWQHDNEDEFFSDYVKCSQRASYSREFSGLVDGVAQTVTLDVSLSLDGGYSEVGVKSSLRWILERVISKFDAWESRAEQIQEPSPPVSIFIGHGRSALWRDLKDHLVDQHHFDVVAYETGTRAGHSIRDILEDMADAASFALLVMTAEDVGEAQEWRARQNVVHEVGLFQGKLGFARAIALVEQGVELFSNLDGVQQIRFSKGNIRETFGDVLATIRREFGRESLRDARD